jgi:hypothetical protein
MTFIAPTDDETTVRWAQFLVAAIAVVLVGLVLIGLITAPAAGQSSPTPTATPTSTPTNTTYYEGANTDVNNETWLAGKEDASLEDQVSLLTRIATMIVGPGPTTQGGGGPAGVLVFGMVLLGSAVAAVGRSTTGAIGGSAVMIALAGGIVELGFVPQWMWAVVLLGIGVMLTASFLRAAR